MTAETQPPITEHQVITATKITNPKQGAYVYEFPYVTSGWARLTVSGPAGTTVTLKYGEELNADGTVQNANSAVTGSPQTDTYILNGHGTETWEPRFSWDGFQYIEVDGYPGTPGTDSVKAVSLHSDIASAGTFSSSSPLLNRINQMARNTMLNNAYGILTDTPEYEKNGWLDDAQVFAPTATDNFGMDTIYDQWLWDMQDSQSSSGLVPAIAPDDGWGLQTAPEWSSALIILAWQVYQAYGDLSAIADHYTAMKRYMSYLTTSDPSLLFSSEYGDWNSPGYEQPPEGTEDSATAYVDLDAQLMAKIATVLGQPSDAAYYTSLTQQITKSFNSHFLNPATGAYHGNNASVTGRETPDVLALAFGLTPGGQTAGTISDLVANVHANNDHLDTGEFGTEYLLPMLTENGDVDLAYKIATQTTYPSWGYWLANGATTCWEGWPLDSRSRDHFFLCSVDGWYYNYLAGIQPSSPGYATTVIKPYVPGGLTSVSASIDTVRGTVASRWHLHQDGKLTLDVTIPPNATAQVEIPAASMAAVSEGGHPAATADGVTFDHMAGTRAVFTVGSGSYHFTTTP